MTDSKERFIAFKWTYKVFRSIIFGAVIAAVGLVVLFYLALSLPPIQNFIKNRAEEEITNFLGGKIEIGEVSFRPFNEVIIHDATLYDLRREKCLTIGQLGAGVNFWKLVFKGEIEITYVELINFNGLITQAQEGAPLNIDFIIQAFQPKDKNKPPAKFDLKIHNIAVRNGSLTYSKLWKPTKPEGLFDENHLQITGLSADIAIPTLRNDNIEIDLRKLSFNEKSGLQVKEIGGDFTLSPHNVAVSKFTVRLPETILNTEDFIIPLDLFSNKDVSQEKLDIRFFNSKITPSNFAAFYPELEMLNTSFPFEVSLIGNKDFLSFTGFRLDDYYGINLVVDAFLKDFTDLKKIEADIQNFKLKVAPGSIRLLSEVIPKLGTQSKIMQIVENIGTAEIEITGDYSAKSGIVNLNTEFKSEAGSFELTGRANLSEKEISGNIDLKIPEINFISFLEECPVEKIADASVSIQGNISPIKIENSTLAVDFNVNQISLLSHTITGIKGSASKSEDSYIAEISVDDENINGSLQLTAVLNDENSKWELDASINDFDTYSSFLSENAASGFELSGLISARATGNSIDNISGEVNLENFQLSNGAGRRISLEDLKLIVFQHDNEFKEISMLSDIADLTFQGKYTISKIPGMIKSTLGEVLPALFSPFEGDTDCGEGNFRLAVKDAKPLIDFFNVPIFPLTELTVEGRLDSKGNIIEVFSEIPYIQQGKNNLITGTYLDLKLCGEDARTEIKSGTVYPTKKGLLQLDMTVIGNSGLYDLNLDFNRGRDVSFYGDAQIKISLEKEEFTGALGVIAKFMPSSLHLNETMWNIEESEITYNADGLQVRDFSLRHKDQFVHIDGYNTKEGEGTLHIELADIFLDYVFETLNIPHVTFGGYATGKVVAQKIFSKEPEIYTEDFVIKKMSYNNALLGDGDIFSRLNLPEKKIAIGASIREDEKIVAAVDGGVWFGRDSLSFEFDTHSVNIAFLQPFMQAFSSEVKGKASGRAHLYGTFSDIDMTGIIAAEDANIRIDYINASYSGNDSVFMYPGRIEIPSFKVKDKFGNTARLSGELRHRYFHDPEFRFVISDMDKLLVYDTNPTINPLWYGKIFASGTGEITGYPGSVRIAADVETEKGSDFTFVLSDQQEAISSHFLTFSDRRKEALIKPEVVDSVPDFLKKFQKTVQTPEESAPDIYTMDFRVSVTPDIQFNLIMDPVGGDKITAFGNGAMTLTYTSQTDEMKLYGKYILEKGSYNFTLQDIIIKDFTIKPGSSIAFTGNPYTGILDITAAYRVNTSLTELDRSFASDRELNRTSVPVEALLKVSGPLTTPHIGFDIELPTVTEETAQKVRSIISTEDMMSRQVLYLVALNKFYSPEYMATSYSGGEWASIASSTLSSQIQNVIGQITDKFTLSPSIRSDKGDFSDIEFDVALSSQLFNNRLLLNGNLGYRDPSNSSTTFVGDFDLEYLLNRNGTWRLKAYNHFNDQNYYLKSALTTQGLGIVWRKEFGLPRKKEKEENMQIENQNITE